MSALTATVTDTSHSIRSMSQVQRPCGPDWWRSSRHDETAAFLDGGGLRRGCSHAGRAAVTRTDGAWPDARPWRNGRSPRRRGERPRTIPSRPDRRAESHRCAGHSPGGHRAPVGGASACASRPDGLPPNPAATRHREAGLGRACADAAALRADAAGDGTSPRSEPGGPSRCHCGADAGPAGAGVGAHRGVGTDASWRHGSRVPWWAPHAREPDGDARSRPDGAAERRAPRNTTTASAGRSTVGPAPNGQQRGAKLRQIPNGAEFRAVRPLRRSGYFDFAQCFAVDHCAGSNNAGSTGTSTFHPE